MQSREPWRIHFRDFRIKDLVKERDAALSLLDEAEQLVATSEWGDDEVQAWLTKYKEMKEASDA